MSRPSCSHVIDLIEWEDVLSSCSHTARSTSQRMKGAKFPLNSAVLSSFRVALLKRTEARLGQRPCHHIGDHITSSARSSMRSRVSTFVEQALKADFEQERVRAQMLSMHWASLLMGAKPETGLLSVLTEALDITLPERLMLEPQQAALEQQQGDAILQRLEQQLLSLPSSHAVCLVEWDFHYGSVKVQGSERLDSQFLNRKTIEQGLMTHKLSCHELWASLMESVSIEDYWQLVFCTLFKQEQASAFLQVRDRFGLPSLESCMLGLASTSPHAMRSFAWLVMAPAAHRVVE